ncbi:MAG: polyhydroxyalkanoate synthesis repressor PhaR [Magnetococcales bacterium]|nr:polyhydroxyalkanoate synthesis repressor PhaR [Magnetococcales bacterium]
MRLIRKYPNRRLYDTERSTYVTLGDIRRLVLENVPFQVVDKQSGEEITRSILLQIISEDEGDGSPVFSTELLQQIIRFYGGTLQGMLGEYLTRSVALFVEQQNQLRTSIDPVTVLGHLTEQNVAFWTSLLPIPLSPQENSSKDEGESCEEPSKK